MRTDSPSVMTTLAWLQEAVEHGHGGGVLGQEPAPGLEGPVGGDARGAAFVVGGDEAERQLGAGVVERGEAQLIADDQLVPEAGSR